jgi:acetylornithine/LysW-gamma-L-lysine aminotransferase
MVTLAKGVAGGLPAGALVWRAELGDFPTMGHGSTYGGNPLISSVALACWDLLTRGGLMERSVKVGSFLLDRLRKMTVPGVAQVRGRGLLIGVELEDRSGPVVKALQERGVLALPAGPKVLRFLPPLVATEEQCEKAVSVLEEILGR